ncbi:hypothetical protein ACQ856_30130 (plasmid) [Mycolicibacterium psychrotolerans]|uniref:hypothetical protein n=1 Tax=Mycolicibacterium psychrotolerans TaxID=216929 RepID=UPI003D679ACA
MTAAPVCFDDAPVLGQHHPERAEVEPSRTVRRSHNVTGRREVVGNDVGRAEPVVHETGVQDLDGDCHRGGGG